MKTLLLRGLAAGLVAGVLAGLVGLVVGEPSMDAAIAIEEAAGDAGRAHDAAPPGAAGGEDETFSRAVQRVGLVLGSGLLGTVLGLTFGVAFAWSIGRMEGDGWTRSMRLGLVALGTLVLVPALAVPANPPGVGDPDTVGVRTAAYLLIGVIGVLLAIAGRLVARAMAEAGMARPVRHCTLGAGALVAFALVLLVQPAPEVAVGDFPADLLWRFRVGALGTQIALYAGVAVAFGLLTVRADRRPQAEHPVSAGRT